MTTNYNEIAEEYNIRFRKLFNKLFQFRLWQDRVRTEPSHCIMGNRRNNFWHTGNFG